MVVNINDVLQHLVSKTAAPSSIGSQLDRLADNAADKERDAIVTARPRGQQYGNPYLARDRQERAIADLAPIARCLADLARVNRCEYLEDKAELRRLRRALPHRGDGELVILVLTAYQEWASTSDKRALAALYSWMHTVAPAMYPAPKMKQETLEWAFRGAEAKKAFQRASEAYADAKLVLDAWVTWWNRKQRGR